MDTEEQNRFRIRIMISGLVILAFYGLGIAFPEPFWATNNPGLLPGWITIAMFAVAGVLFSSPFWWQERGNTGETKQINSSRRNLLFLLLSAFMAFIYSQFPIYKDINGDAYHIIGAVNIEIPHWDNRLLTEFFEPDWLDTKVGLKTWYQVNNFFTWLSGMNGVDVARTIGFVMGGIWGFVWMKFVDLHLPHRGWKWLFIALGLTAPFTLVFMGHYETYAFSYTGILIWISALGIYFKTENKIWLRALPIIFLLLLQTHITNWLFFPTLIMAFIWHFRHKPGLLKRLDALIRKKFPRYQGGLSWSGVLVYYFIPAMLLGAYAYFFVFANHDGPRKFTEDSFESTLFLPLYTDEPPPYDRYNLFSPAHFSDYLNLMFMWSGAVLLLLIPPLTFLRKKVPWNDPFILITGSTALLMSLVFFVLNPLLTAGLDWDLYVTPALVILPFLVLVYSHLVPHLKLKNLAGPALALCLMGTSFQVVNASSELLSVRLGHLGRWTFKTYWIGTSTILVVGAELAGDREAQEEFRLKVLKDLEPYAITGNDTEYAGLLLSEGKVQKQERNNAKALEYFERAYSFSPRLGTNLYQLTTTHFEAGNLAEAHRYVKELVTLKYQPYKRTLKMGIHISLAAKEYQSAADYAVTYLNRWQDDPAVAEVERRLRTGDRIETLVELFGVK